MKNTFFLAINPGGISNRLKCLISMWRFAKKRNGELLLYWPKNKTCNVNFSDLFENKIKLFHKKDLIKIFKSKNYSLFNESLNILKKSKKEYVLSESWRWGLFKNDVKNGFAKENPSLYGKNIDLEFKRTPLKLRGEFLPYLKKLKPIKEIKEKVDLFDKKNNLKKLIGIHLRQGDFLNYRDGMEKIANTTRFSRKINDILKKIPSQKFFLCTDSRRAEDYLRHKFPDKIISFEKSSFDRLDKKFNQEGLIDLLLLSKTKKIIGTYMSTFTELAWWIGECKVEVDILATEKEKEKYLKHIKKSNKNLIDWIKKNIYNLIFSKHKRILNSNTSQ